MWQMPIFLPFLDSHICRNGIFQKCFHIFLIFVEVIRYHTINKKKLTRGSKIQKSWECSALVLHIRKPKFYSTKIDPNNSPELLNLLFKHMSFINSSNNHWKSPKLCLPICCFFFAMYGRPNAPLIHSYRYAIRKLKLLLFGKIGQSSFL